MKCLFAYLLACSFHAYANRFQLLIIVFLFWVNFISWKVEKKYQNSFGFCLSFLLSLQFFSIIYFFLFFFFRFSFGFGVCVFASNTMFSVFSCAAIRCIHTQKRTNCIKIACRWIFASAKRLPSAYNSNMAFDRPIRNDRWWHFLPSICECNMIDTSL